MMLVRHSVPALLWALFIFILTMMPGRYIPPVNIWDFASWDKVAHLAVFAVLIVLVLKGFIRQRGNGTVLTYPLSMAFIICSGYGFLLEVMQGTLLTDRYFEWHDALANMLGCGAGILIFKWFKKQ